MNKRLTKLDERSPLTFFWCGHVDGIEFLGRSHSRELERVIFVSFSFDIGPFPCVFIGGTDNRLSPKFRCQVMNPSGWATCFHDNQITWVLFEDRSQVISFRSRVDELVLSCFCVEIEAHRVEFTEVECENLHRRLSVGLGLENVTRSHRDHGSESPVLTKTPAPNLGLTWILQAENYLPEG